MILTKNNSIISITTENASYEQTLINNIVNSFKTSLYPSNFIILEQAPGNNQLFAKIELSARVNKEVCCYLNDNLSKKYELSDSKLVNDVYLLSEFFYTTYNQFSNSYLFYLTNGNIEESLTLGYSENSKLEIIDDVNSTTTIKASTATFGGSIDTPVLYTKLFTVKNSNNENIYIFPFTKPETNQILKCNSTSGNLTWTADETGVQSVSNGDINGNSTIYVDNTDIKNPKISFARGGIIYDGAMLVKSATEQLTMSPANGFQISTIPQSTSSSSLDISQLQINGNDGTTVLNNTSLDTSNITLSNKLHIGQSLSFSNSYSTNIEAVSNANSSTHNLLCQNKSDGSTASTNIYLTNDATVDENANYCVIGMNGHNYGGSDYISDGKDQLYISNTNKDIAVATNFIGSGAGIHLTSTGGLNAISIAPNNAISLNTTYNHTTDTHTYDCGVSGEFMMSQGTNTHPIWFNFYETATYTLNLNWGTSTNLFFTSTVKLCRFGDMVVCHMSLPSTQIRNTYGASYTTLVGDIDLTGTNFIPTTRQFVAHTNCCYFTTANAYFQFGLASINISRYDTNYARFQIAFNPTSADVNAVSLLTNQYLFLGANNINSVITLTQSQTFTYYLS